MAKTKSSIPLIGILITGLVTITATIAAYILVLRPRHLRWGATDEEVDHMLPGDELVPNPRLKATHAITVQAPPNKVWPWLVQLGQGRGGFYSYDWIENAMGLDIHTADRILPEHQTLEVGDVIPLAADGFGVTVAMVEPERALVLHGDTRQPGPGEAPVLKPGDHFAVSWGFYLFERPDGATRFVERWQADWNPAPHNNVLYRVFLEPGAFIMERKMLLGIKERAESLAQM
jgi:hypothetical protein